MHILQQKDKCFQTNPFCFSLIILVIMDNNLFVLIFTGLKQLNPHQQFLPVTGTAAERSLEHTLTYFKLIWTDMLNRAVPMVWLDLWCKNLLIRKTLARLSERRLVV